MVGGQWSGLASWYSVYLAETVYKIEVRAAMSLLHYRELTAWQKSMALVTRVYALSKAFPLDERFGLTSQIRRASISVPSNIAEGQGRDSTREFIHHLSIAYGSLMEVETQILIGRDLGYLERQVAATFLEESAETGRIINGLVRSLRKKLATEH